MAILEKITSILAYPAIFGLVFGTFIIIYGVVYFVKSTWHNNSKAENHFIIILLSCFLIGLIFLPLNHIVKVNSLNESASGTGVGIYDEIAEYAAQVYDTDISDALFKLRDDLHEDSNSFCDYDKGYDDGYKDGISSDSAYYDMGHDDGYADGYYDGYDDARAGKPNVLDEEQTQ